MDEITELNGELSAILLDLNDKEKASELIIQMIEKCKAKGDLTATIYVCGCPF